MKKFAILLILAVTPALADAEGYEITRYSIAGGGVIESTSDNWTLSGTIGQWEATEPRELEGGQWSLTGGFWADILERVESILFQDRFEDESS